MNIGAAAYAERLPRLSDADRAYVREQATEVSLIRQLDPLAPTWGEMYYGWTAEAMDSPEPVAALEARR